MFNKLIENFGNVGAPVAPAPTKPAPARPAPARPQRIDPFRPPKPSVLPKPKAYYLKENIEIVILSNIISEAYEDEAHPANQEFWDNIPDNHIFSRHPILSKHGNNLNKSAFDHTSKRAEQTGSKNINMMQIFQQILQIEREFKNQLVELAKDITQKIWKIDRNMLHAELTMEVNGGGGGGGPNDEDDSELPSEYEQEVHKRITMNTLTQGSAVHAMLTIHHLVDQAINKINPNLLRLYNQIAASSIHQYWLIDIPSMLANLANMKAGEEEIQFGDDGEPMVIARAVCFPVLCQELSKGVMELLTTHGVSALDAKVQGHVIKHADKLGYEPWQIQVGPELWRKFIGVVKGLDIARVVAELSKKSPDHVHYIVNAIIEHPDEAKELLSRLIAEPEQELEQDIKQDDFNDEDGEEWKRGNKLESKLCNRLNKVFLKN